MSVDNPREIPDQYRDLFERRGIDLTYRALHRRVQGVGLNSVVRALTGEGRPSDRVARAVADALGITPERLLELRGDPVAEPFQLPVRASQLNQPERDAVLAVVHALLDARDRHADQSPTPADPPAEGSGAQGQAGKDQKTDDLARRRGRDFATDPMIDRQAAAYDPPGPTDADQAAGPDPTDVNDGEAPEGGA